MSTEIILGVLHSNILFAGLSAKLGNLKKKVRRPMAINVLAFCGCNFELCTRVHRNAFVQLAFNSPYVPGKCQIHLLWVTFNM